MKGFTGFSQESLDLLVQIKAHNSKAWFEKHRSDYEALLLEPFRALVSELAPTILSIDPDIEVRPAVNKTISRIFRDTRFSSDKSLFRDVMWLVFKRPGKDWTISVPGFYFELSPLGYRYGAGFYSASPAVMAAFRKQIDDDPDTFSDVISFLAVDRRYTLAGESYKRAMPSVHPPDIDEWYQKKTFYLVSEHPPDRMLFSEELAAELRDGFLLVNPLYRYLELIKPE